ncbi:MAG: glycine/betaine/sarcosine/D-proline family reductase selenoprotein B [Candidatus Binatia bacterium]
MRVVHYLNQFFGGIGAEEHAGTPLEVRDSAVGPGRLLEPLLGDEARVVMTLICGDNYAVENQETLTASVLEKIRQVGANLFVAGPCFDAGRYGMAAGALCAAVQSELKIPVIAGMSEENPGVDLYRDALYIVDSGSSPVKMREVLGKMANLGKKLIGKAAIGLPAEREAEVKRRRAGGSPFKIFNYHSPRMFDALGHPVARSARFISTAEKYFS